MKDPRKQRALKKCYTENMFHLNELDLHLLSENKAKPNKKWFQIMKNFTLKK